MHDNTDLIVRSDGMPMMLSTILFLVLVVISVLLGPETKGKTLTADLEVTKVVAQPAT